MVAVTESFGRLSRASAAHRDRPSHTLGDVTVWEGEGGGGAVRAERFGLYCTVVAEVSVHVSIRQHTPAYASIRQHTSAYVSIRMLTYAELC